MLAFPFPPDRLALDFGFKDAGRRRRHAVLFAACRHRAQHRHHRNLSPKKVVTQGSHALRTIKFLATEETRIHSRDQFRIFSLTPTAKACLAAPSGDCVRRAE